MCVPRSGIGASHSAPTRLFIVGVRARVDGAYTTYARRFVASTRARGAELGDAPGRCFIDIKKESYLRRETSEASRFHGGHAAGLEESHSGLVA